MSTSEGDQRVVATAHQILKTLGNDKANDMLRILSTFDDRFSRFSLNANGVESISPSDNLPSGLQINNPVVQSAEEIILKWDTASSEIGSQSFIWTEHLEEAGQFLEAIDAIQDLFDNPPLHTDVSVLDHLENILQISMLRLEQEANNILLAYGGPVDADWLFDTVYNNGGNPDDSGLKKSFVTMDIELLPVETVADLCDIAHRMVVGGYQAECTQIFVTNRRANLEESLQRLGLERPTIEEVQKMPWELLESEITKWVRIAKLAVGVLFHSEKELCKSVFKDNSPSLSEPVFNDIARASMTHLLNFAEAIAIGRRAPEKLFKVLDMYEALRDLLPSIESLFVGESCEALRSEASSIIIRLGDAVRGTFVEFENAVQRDVARVPVPGGAVHPLTRYVMNYIKFFSDYTETLNHLLKDRRLGHVESFCGRSEECVKTPLSAVTLTLMGLLEKNLDAKSKLYKDPALTYLFLMNNLHYMVQKSKDPEVRKLVGDDWIKRHTGKVHQYHNEYRRTAWAKVLACLRDDGIHYSGSSGSSSSGATRNLLKERFKNFNAAFEETVKAQTGWVVSDPQLCAELQNSITLMILPAYRSFLGRFQNYLDGKYTDRYVRFSPEDVEVYLSELFEGSSGSMTRR